MPSQDTVVSVIRGDGIAVVIVGDAREWERVWVAREEFDSDATLWLRTLAQKPQLAKESLTWPDYGSRCRSYPRIREQALVRYWRHGLLVLADREFPADRFEIERSN